MAEATFPAHAVCTPAEFEQLLAQQMLALRHLALRFTRKPDLAEDLVHDTVVRALTFRDRFVAGSNFRAWIRTVLTNTFLHRHRRLKREKEILGTVSRFDVVANLRSEATRRKTREPEKMLTDAGFDDTVERALRELPSDFRAVVTLCDVEGLSYKEASAALACPIGTVMSRLHRGRRLLKDNLRTTAAEKGIGLANSASEPSQDAPRGHQRQASASRRGVVTLAAVR